MFEKFLILAIKTFSFFHEESKRYDDLYKPSLEGCDCGKFDFDNKLLVCFLHPQNEEVEEEFHFWVV